MVYAFRARENKVPHTASKNICQFIHQHVPFSSLGHVGNQKTPPYRVRFNWPGHVNGQRQKRYPFLWAERRTVSCSRRHTFSISVRPVPDRRVLMIVCRIWWQRVLLVHLVHYGAPIAMPESWVHSRSWSEPVVGRSRWLVRCIAYIV